MPVRFDEHLEFDRRRVALGWDGKVDLNQNRCTTDANGRHGRIDFHVAVLGRLTRDECDGPLHQAEQRGIVRPIGVVDHFVEDHPRIRREAEHGAVDESDA